MTVALTAKEFERTVSAPGIVLIDWWAAWCRPCRAFAPIFEAASQRHPDLTWAKIDTEAEGSLAGAFGIRSIPTLTIFRDGVVVFEQPGLIPAQALEKLVAEVRALDMDEVRRQLDAADAEQDAQGAA